MWLAEQSVKDPFAKVRLSRSFEDPIFFVHACPGADPKSESMNHQLQTQPGERLANTTLKWGQDGELSSEDRDRILELLCAVDPVANVLIDQIDSFSP
jgi:hypothetical protein